MGRHGRRRLANGPPRDVGNLASVYMSQGRLQLALTYLRRHQELARQYGDDSELSRAVHNHAAVLMYLGKPEEGLPGLEQAYQQFYEQGRPVGYLSALADLAVAHPVTLAYTMLHILALRVQALCAAPEQAEEALHTAIALAREHGRALEEASALLSLCALTEDPAERAQLWAAGMALLEETGAAAWLEGHSVDNPPLIAPML